MHPIRIGISTMEHSTARDTRVGDVREVPPSNPTWFRWPVAFVPNWSFIPLRHWGPGCSRQGRLSTAGRLPSALAGPQHRRQLTSSSLEPLGLLTTETAESSPLPRTKFFPTRVKMCLSKSGFFGIGIYLPTHPLGLLGA